jgi:cytochrome c-type biogenesis protein CcmF
LLGTFLVRSGVLVSVHAFASDPTRGVFILTLLAVVIGGALGLFAWRAPHLDQPVGFKPFSRETFLLINTILLSIATGLILLGTIYPLVVDAMNLGKISVGKPYFETVFLLPMLPLVIAAGVGMHVAWRSADGAALLRRLRWLAIVAILIGIGFPLVAYGSNNVLTAVGMAAGLWLVLSSCRDPIARLLGKGPRITQSMLAMQLAHIGVGLFVIGVTTTSSFSIETDQRIVAGETVTVADYTIRMGEVSQVEGPNYTALRAEMEVTRAGKPVAILYPEKRLYRVQQSPMTEADIDDSWSRHLFIALGDQLGQNAWSVRIQYKPLIRLIWFGAFVMALGGLIGVTDARYRLKKVATEIDAAQADSVTAS